MSKITLTPNASGTGTFTVASPNSNTNRTLTLPDEAGELLINGTTSNVGIGTSSPATALEVKTGSSGTQPLLTLYQADNTPSNKWGINFSRTTGSASADVVSKIYANREGGDATGLTFDVTDSGGTTSEAMRIDSSGNVGINATTVTPIGSSNPTLQINGTSTSEAGCLRLRSTNGGVDAAFWANSSAAYFGTLSNDPLTFRVNNSERMRLDSSGNLLVGTTSSFGSSGITLGSNKVIYAAASSQNVANFQRYTTDGEIVRFGKDGTTVGSIGAYNGAIYIASPDGTDAGLRIGNGYVAPATTSGAFRDNAIDIGHSSGRFDDIYATNGTIQTSDRNEKQDIEALSDAEQRVAVACKGLLRKFRWIDSVAEKGDDARIHFGIIAQDLQDAFAAEGLYAGRYAMFTSSTWWETQTEVPAVEAVEAVYEDVVIPAVLDEDGDEVEAERIEQQLVTQAVEAKEAYTRTDTYETLEEAPEGATERTRLGVRYPELLAFIIGAM